MLLRLYLFCRKGAHLSVGANGQGGQWSRIPTKGRHSGLVDLGGILSKLCSVGREKLCFLQVMYVVNTQ